MRVRTRFLSAVNWSLETESIPECADCEVQLEENNELKLSIKKKTSLGIGCLCGLSCASSRHLSVGETTFWYPRLRMVHVWFSFQSVHHGPRSSMVDYAGAGSNSSRRSCAIRDNEQAGKEGLEKRQTSSLLPWDAPNPSTVHP